MLHRHFRLLAIPSVAFLISDSVAFVLHVLLSPCLLARALIQLLELVTDLIPMQATNAVLGAVHDFRVPLEIKVTIPQRPVRISTTAF